MSDTGVDVVIVGGGPVGVSMSLFCARHGLRSVVLERATSVYDLPRAIVRDDEVLRALWLHGAPDGLDTVTSPLPGAEFVDAEGRRIIGIELPVGIEFPLSFAPAVRYYQPDLEVFLRDHALRAGVEVRLGVEVRSVTQDADGVTATLDDGTVVCGRWMVAADGGSSPIRKALGIEFVDQGFDQDWLVVDVRLHDGAGDELPRFVQQLCDPVRPATFVPGHGPYRRWEFQLQPGEQRDEMPARVWELLAPWLGPDEAQVVRAVVYRFHATVAATFRAGRIFLAGDAAHQMPPFLGQGLCTGIRDAANLAWKLQWVTVGRAGERLLDTYDRERRPHAAGVVAHAVDSGRLIDQLAGRGGAQDGLDSAYGGQRPFPHHVDGFLAGDEVRRGRQVPNVVLSDGTRLDDTVGPDLVI
ncbi:MAG: bifunctional 3-(3-hydroxy-phenyl)propionate/3-hydroxycinnamic acid hydroxylase, partial [Acidimicrobiia bacterium]